MRRYIIKRILQALATMFIVCLIVFVMGHMSGDPTMFILGANASDADREALREMLGLNKPLLDQFVDYFWGILHGDFGTSLTWREPTLTLFAEFFPMTLKLAIAAAIFASILGITLGVFSAVRPMSLLDRFCVGISMIGQSTPSFWTGILLVQVFSLALGLLPSSGSETAAHMILPTIALGWFSTSSIMRITRSSMIEVLSAESIKLCRTKGLPERLVVWKHALKNALPSVLTIVGVQFGYLLSGSVVTEKIFAWPGIGRLCVSAIFNRDLPVIIAYVLVMAVFFILFNLLSDLALAALDPRARRGGAGEAA